VRRSADIETLLIVMPVSTQRGGGELMLEQFLRWKDDEIEVVVVFLQPGPMLQAAQDLGARVYFVDAGRLRQPQRLLSAIIKIARIAMRVNADLVLGWMTKGHLYSGPAAGLVGTPAVWYQLGTARSSSWLDRAAAAIPARGILTLSCASAEAQSRIRPTRRQELVYPGAELDDFNPDSLPCPAAARTQLGSAGEGPVVGMVGRLQRWKGFHVLIEAMPEVLARYPDATCVLVGGDHALEPEYPEVLRQQVSQLGITANVAFTGYQSDVPMWMQSMDVVVHASANEPFGIVVIEAMALGKPVVAGSDGGPKEIITTDVHGLLVDFGDRDGLARALLRLLDDPSLAKRVGEAARQRATDFSARKYAVNLTAALRRLIVPVEVASSTIR